MAQNFLSDIKLGDGIYIRLGDRGPASGGGDLNLSHNGTNSFIDNHTGNVYIRNFSDDKNIHFQTDDGSEGVKDYIVIHGDENIVKFQEHSRHLDNKEARFGTGSDLKIYHESSSGSSYIKEAGSGDLRVLTSRFVLNNAADTENMFRATSDGAVELYYDAVKELETNTNGVKIINNLGIGVNPSSVYGIYQDFNATDANIDNKFAYFIDADFSGADNTDGDREQGGIRIDIDSTADGDASEEHRLYGVWSDVRFSGYSDLVRAGYFYAENNMVTGSEQQQETVGVYASAVADGTNTNAGTNNLKAVQGQASVQNVGYVNAAYGGFFQSFLAGVRTADANHLVGVRGEVEIDSSSSITLGNARAVQAIIDVDNTTPTVTNSFLYYGGYEGTTSNITNKYGLYLLGSDNINRISGKTAIGETTTPSNRLHVLFSNADTSFSGGSAGNWGSEGVRIENTSGTVGTMAMLQFRNSDADIHIASIRRGTDDSDLGFFFEGTQKVLFENDGSATFEGHVNITGSSKNLVLANSNNIRFKNNAGAERNILTLDANDDVQFGGSIDDIRFLTNDSSDKMIIKSDGKVGIGTDNPLNTLHVSTSDEATALFQSTDAISKIEFADNNTTGSTRPSIGASGNNTIFTQGTTERMRIASDGTITFNAYGAGLLKTNANGVISVDTGIIDGSGTAGRIPKFSDSNTLADSRIFESTTGTYIHDSDSTTPLQVTKGGTTFVKFVGLSTINNSYIEIPPGTEAIPAINFGRRHSTGAVDTDTGIYSSAANHIEIATGGSKAFGINSSQNATFEGTIASGAITVTGGSNQTVIDADIAFDLTDGSKDTLLITNNKTTSAVGAIGPSIGFGNMNSDRRTSAIGAIRTGSDHDQMGLAFFTHPGTGNDDTVVKQLELAHDGTATFTGNVTVTGDFQVNGTTTTVNATNLDLSDNIIGLNRGANSNSNDSGIIIERGNTGDNAAMIWDEANDRFVFGLTTSTPAATGSVSISQTSNLAARDLDVNTITSAAITASGDITLDDNSGASPSLYLYNGDNNYWRIFNGSSLDLTFRVGTVTKFNIDSSGNATLSDGTAKKLSILASTHNTNVANTATLELGYGHSGGSGFGNIVLTEDANNSFGADMTFGVPHNNSSGGSTTRTALTLDGGTLAATFVGNVTLNSRLTFEYNGSGTGNNYLETGTNTLHFKNSSGTSTLGLNFSDQSSTFGGDVNVQNASTRFISLNYEDSVNSIISHSGTNFGLESLNVRGDNIYFYTDYDSGTPKGNLTLTLDNSHNAKFEGTLGIAGSSPVSTSALTIKSTSASSQQSAIDIIQNGGTNSIIRMGEKSTDGGRFHMFDGGTEKIAFYTDGTDNHISAGKVGIGTDSPNGKLHVRDTSTQLILETPNTTNDIDFRWRENGTNKWNMRYQNSGNHLQFLNQTSGSTVTQLSLNADNSSTFAGDVQISKSVGDAVLTIEADTDNNEENDNPRVELKQDSGIIYGHFGINGDANSAFTGAGSNATYIKAAGGFDIAVSANVRALQIDTSTNATFSGNLTMSQSNSSSSDFINQNTHGTGTSRIIAQSNTTAQNAQLVADDNNAYSWVGTSSGGTNHIAFRDNTNAYYNGGNFGVGTSAPGAKLNVFTGGNSIAAAAVLQHDTFATDRKVGLGFELGDTQIKAAVGFISDASSPGTHGRGNLIFCVDSNDDAAPVSHSDEKVRISHTGNVGIGTAGSQPTYKLQVQGTGYFNETVYINGTTTVDADLKITGSGEDTLVIGPQSAGSGTILMSLNAAENAYEPLRIDAEVFQVTASGGTNPYVIETSGLNTTFGGNITGKGYLNLSNGYGSTKGLYLNGNPAVWREDNDNLRLPLPVARFNEIVTVGNQNSNNNGSGADGRYATGILDLSTGGFSSGTNYFRIETNIPFNSSGADFTVVIEGFRYGARKPVHLTICWHIYPANTPYNHCVISHGGWSPVIKMARNTTTNNVTLLLESPGYWPKMYVKSLHSSNYEVGAYAKGWTWANGDLSSGYDIVTTIPYQALSLGNGGIVNGGDINGDSLALAGHITLTGSSKNIVLNYGNEIRTKDSGGTERTVLRAASNKLQYGWSYAGAVEFMGGGSYTPKITIETDGSTTFADAIVANTSNGKWRVNDYGAMYFRNSSNATHESYIHSRSDGSLSIGRVAESNWTGTGNAAYAATTYDHVKFDTSSNATFTGHVDAGGRVASLAGSSQVQLTEYNNGAAIWLDGSDGDLAGADYFGIHAYGTTDLAFSYGAATKITMKNDGKLGIGTDSPEQYLHVKRADNASVLFLERTGNNAGYVLLNGSINPQVAFPSNQDLRFVTVTNSSFDNASEKMRITSGGKVGIGISTPNGTGTNLQVQSDSHSQIAAHFGQGQSNSNTQYGGISLGYAEAANALYRKVAIVAEARGDGAARQNLHFLVDTANDSASAVLADSKMKIDGLTGYVGIGSTTPSHKLQVYDATSDAPLMIESGDGFVGMKFKDPDANDNLYYRGDIQAFYFTGNRLGINTSSPQEDLHIYGDTPVIRLTDSDTSRDAQIVAIDGNLRFDADNNNDQSGTNISFRTDGSERARIDSAGRFFLGHTSTLLSSSEKFSVSAGTNGINVFSNTSTGNGTLYLQNTNTSTTDWQTYLIFQDGAGNRAQFGNFYNDSKLGISGHGGIAFKTGATSLANATTALTIDTSQNATFEGNVTIEKSTPVLTFNNLAGGGLDPILTATGTNFTISTSSITPFSLALDDGTLTLDPGQAGNKPLKLVGNYSGSGDVKILEFVRVGDAVAGAIEYNDATTDMEIGTVTNHAFSIKTNDTRRLTFANSGAATFAGDVDFDGHITLTGSSKNIVLNYGNEIRTKDSGGTERTVLRASSNKLQYGWSYNGAVEFMGGGSYSPRITIQTDGTVLQTATTIDGALTINPDADSSASIKNAGTNAIALFAASGDTLYLGGNDTTGMYLDTNAYAWFASDLRVPQYIKHIDDVSTLINFESSQITIATSGGSHIQINNDENIYYRTNGTNRFKMDTGGTFTATADIVAYGSVSDKSYKENIKPITGALDLVSNLKGVTFNWKEDTDTNKMVGIKEDIGFIAQDVQEVLPELVRENDNGKLSLRDKGIVPVLVEAIKELKAEIEELKCKCDGCTK